MGENNIIFENYSKIKSTLAWLSNNIIIKMNVGLYRNTKRGGRVLYHSETQYYDNRAKESVINMEINVDPYLTIESLKAINGEKEYIQIKSADMIQLRFILDNIITLYRDKFNDIFYIEKGVYKINNTLMPDIIYNFTYGKEIIFSPSLVNSELADGTQRTDGVITMRLSRVSSVDMNLSKLYEFREILNINLYTYGQALLNYLQRPEYGTELKSVVMDNSCVMPDDNNAGEMSNLQKRMMKRNKPTT